MNIHEEIELQECPFCGGPGLLEEENGWSVYAMCAQCGSQTAPFEFNTPEEREEAAGGRAVPAEGGIRIGKRNEIGVIRQGMNMEMLKALMVSGQLHGRASLLF